MVLVVQLLFQNTLQRNNQIYTLELQFHYIHLESQQIEE